MTAIFFTYGLTYNFRKAGLIILLLLCWNSWLHAQEPVLKSVSAAEEILDARGEVILRFVKPPHISMDVFSGILSVDDYRNDTVVAYANEQGYRQFLQLQINHEFLQPPSLKRSEHHKKTEADWHNKYPSYTEYLNLMRGFSYVFPDICRVEEFGESINGKKLLALKITKNPEVREKEPVVLYTAGIHGDELLGTVLLLRLIEYLLNNYQAADEVRELVDRLEIWINPMANPDGAYFISDTSVAGAVRFNAAHVDLNRDFPDIRNDNWAAVSRQPETTAMMNFMKEVRPALSAGFHGGAEVVNYPWDTWSRLHADDTWYRAVSRAYADTVHQYSTAGYMTFLDNGITNGYDWYSVYGGRQDYTNCLLHGREVTIELSDDKMPPEDELEVYWNYNKRSLLQYLGQALTGISGEVTDSLTELPVTAKVRMVYHDRDSSFVVSSSSAGFYTRLMVEGSYVLQFEAPGYQTERHVAQVSAGLHTLLDVKMNPLSKAILYPNPFGNTLYFFISVPGYNLTLEVFDLAGRKCREISQHVTDMGWQDTDVSGLKPGLYIIRLTYRSQTVKQLMMKGYQ
ncbi:MAG: T9SS type A sorting domain-containing protein [Bacteroidales bacterium]|nr:T9SS type A sorting domain-containing protein [Bacteroidales bacterium]